MKRPPAIDDDPDRARALTERAERRAALEAITAHCKTGFEAWEALAAKGAIPIEWLDDARRVFAVRAGVLRAFARARHEVPAASRVVIKGLHRLWVTPTPAERAFALSLVALDTPLDTIERLAVATIASFRAFNAEPPAERAPVCVWKQRAHTALSGNDAVAPALRAALVVLWPLRSARRVYGLDPDIERRLVDTLPKLYRATRRSKSWVTMFAEEWALALASLAPLATRTGAIEASVDLTGLDGSRQVRIEPWQRSNPFSLMAELYALGVQIVDASDAFLVLALRE
ncbi:MAG: hypothetical protein JNK05_16680 [Myxococcales bacterium]|nr:hypothetical protein [Myxococcales bacterium]